MGGMEIVLHWLHEARDLYKRTLSGGDSRTSSWPLMDSPLPTLAICLSYAYFVKVLGPRLMKDREPLNIRWLMVAYNFFMVIVSAAIFGLLGIYGWFGSYNWYCQPVDYSDSKEAILMTHIAWWYYISKFVEFADTLFFVARKKFSHISTLHVIHHGMMPMSVWWGVKFTPGGHSTFFAFVNSLVHILMYFYYGLAAIGPHMQKYLWWKQYMTSFQMVQFIAIFVHSFQLLFRPDCDYPHGFMWWIGFHAVMFWFLFADFYRNAYMNQRATAMKNGAKVNGKHQHVNGNGPAGEKREILNGYCYLNGLHDGDDSDDSGGDKNNAVNADADGRTNIKSATKPSLNGSHSAVTLNGGPRTRARVKKVD